MPARYANNRIPVAGIEIGFKDSLGNELEAIPNFNSGSVINQGKQFDVIIPTSTVPAPNVIFGTIAPTFIAGTHNENDTYIQTSNGQFNGNFIASYVADATSGNWVRQDPVSIKTKRLIQALVALPSTNTIVHNLGLVTPFAVDATVRDSATGQQVLVRVTSETTNSVIISTPTAIPSAVINIIEIKP